MGLFDRFLGDVVSIQFFLNEALNVWCDTPIVVLPDEPYNATPEPLRGLADRLMERNDIAPVPDYDVVIEGPDAAHIVNNVLAELEIGVQPSDGTKTRTQRSRVTPSDFFLDHQHSAFRVRNPVDLEPLVKGDGRHGEPWPDSYSIGSRLIDIDGEYINPAWADA